MQGNAAELDYMLRDSGEAVVFTRGASVLATTYCQLDRTQIFQPGINGLEETGHDITVGVRDGTIGATTIDDVATIGGVAYRVRGLGVLLASGMRMLSVAGG